MLNLLWVNDNPNEETICAIQIDYQLKKELNNEQADKFMRYINNQGLGWHTFCDNICDENDPHVWMRDAITEGETLEEVKARLDQHFNRALKCAFAEQLSFLGETYD